MVWYRWKCWRFALCAGNHNYHNFTVYDGHGRWCRLIGRLYWLVAPDD